MRRCAWAASSRTGRFGASIHRMMTRPVSLFVNADPPTVDGDERGADSLLF
jgi:hypothetical protein